MKTWKDWTVVAVLIGVPALFFPRHLVMIAGVGIYMMVWMLLFMACFTGLGKLKGWKLVAAWVALIALTIPMGLLPYECGNKWAC